MTQLSAAVVTDVLVVGAGPTRIVAAAVLARARTSCIIVDAAAEPTGTSKAAIVHAATLELLDEIDAAEELMGSKHGASAWSRCRPHFSAAHCWAFYSPCREVRKRRR